MKECVVAVGRNRESEIAAAIREAVLDQRLLPGAKLPEEELAEVFSTSRARVRRVLLGLSQERIVTLFPGRGAFIAAPSQVEAGEVIAARLLVEVGILEQRRAPIGPVPASLREIVVAEQSALGVGDRVGMIRLSGGFHLALARWLANAVVADILERLILRTSLIIALYEPVTGACCLPRDHDALLKALSGEQTGRAAVLMAEHLNRLRDHLDFSRRPKDRTRLRDVLRPAAEAAGSFPWQVPVTEAG